MRIDATIFALKTALDSAAVPLYRIRGCPPWSPGYFTAKRRAIEYAIDRNVVRKGHDLPPRFGIALDERVIEYPWLFDQLRRQGSVRGRYLDAGSALNHRFLLRREPLRGLDLTMMTLAPEKWCQWYDGYSYAYGDLRDTYFRDGAFDGIVSISTIEHIGLDNTVLYTQDQARRENDEKGYLAAVREFKRLLRPGGICFATFPFGRHRSFGWYQVFDNHMVELLMDAFRPASQEREHFAYTPYGWRRVSQQEAQGAEAYDVHTGKGYGKDRAASSRAIACLRLVA